MFPDKKIDNGFYITGWICIIILVISSIIIKIMGVNLLMSIKPCAFSQLFNLYCPGCGGTRAFFALLRGDILRSLYYHPFDLYAITVCGWFMISQTIQRLSRDRIKIGMHFRPIYLWLALGIILVNWIVKNLFIIVGGIYLLH